MWLASVEKQNYLPLSPQWLKLHFLGKTNKMNNRTLEPAELGSSLYKEKTKKTLKKGWLLKFCPNNLMPRTAGGGPHIAWPLIQFFASFWLYFLMTRATGEIQNRELGIILSNFLLSLSRLRGWQPLDLFLQFPEHFPWSADLQSAVCIT